MSIRWEEPAEAQVAMARKLVIESGLRRFYGRGATEGMIYDAIYTDSRRPTVGWIGINDEEVRALTARKLATVGPVLQDGRQRVTLTDEGKRLRAHLRLGSKP